LIWQAELNIIKIIPRFGPNDSLWVAHEPLIFQLISSLFRLVASKFFRIRRSTVWQSPESNWTTVPEPSKMPGYSTEHSPPPNTIHNWVFMHPGTANNGDLSLSETVRIGLQPQGVW
jgi:hypothetical protein